MTRGSKSFSHGYKRKAQTQCLVRYGAATTIEPTQLVAFAQCSHACLEDLVCRVSLKKVPYFNAPVYLANREFIGKVDEVFGTLSDFSVSVRLVDPKKAKQYLAGVELYTDPVKLLPMSRFLPEARKDFKPKSQQQRKRKKNNNQYPLARPMAIEEKGCGFNNRRRNMKCIPRKK